MAPQLHGGGAPRSPPCAPGSQRPGARRARVALSLPLVLLLWLNGSETSLPAPRKVQPLDRSVLAVGFGEEGGRSLEERARGRAEGGGRSVQRQHWQIAICFPSPKCRAGARGSAATAVPPPPPKSRGSAGAWSYLLLIQEEPSPEVSA
jgi:hypothetical protein